MIVNVARWLAMLVSLCITLPLAAQEMSAETKERLCAERRTTLARLEQEEPQLRLQADALARKIAGQASPNRPRTAELEAQRWRGLHSTATAADRAVIEVQIQYWEKERSYWDRIAQDPDRAATISFFRDPVARRLDGLFAELQGVSQRQTYVAGQILVLREGMESLGCAGVAPPAGAAQAPPIVTPPSPPGTTSTPPSGPTTRPATVAELSGKWVARMNVGEPGLFQEFTLTVGPWQNGEFSGPLRMTSTNAPVGHLPPWFDQHVYAIRPSSQNRYTVQQTGKIVRIDQRGERLAGMTNFGWSGRTEVVPLVPSRGPPYEATFDGRTLAIRVVDPPLAFVKVSR